MRYYSIAFGSAMFLVLVVVGYFSCNQPRPIPAIIGERIRSTRKVETTVSSTPPQRIDSVLPAKIIWRTRYVDRFIHDTIGYIAISDSIRGEKGTVFVVQYDTYKRVFDVPYLQERPDTTKTITDSIVIERTVQAESSFWGDVGKIAGGFLGGFILGGGVK